MIGDGWWGVERLAMMIVLNQSCNSPKNDVQFIISGYEHKWKNFKIVDKKYNNSPTIGHVNNILTMQFFIGISRNTQSKS